MLPQTPSPSEAAETIAVDDRGDRGIGFQPVMLVVFQSPNLNTGVDRLEAYPTSNAAIIEDIIGDESNSPVAIQTHRWRRGPTDLFLGPGPFTIIQL
jgi:hypothetical protein